MEKLKRIYKLYRDNSKYINIAVIILIIIAAVLFFGEKGENQTIEVPAGDNMESELMLADSEEAEEPGSDYTGLVYVDISGQVKNPGVYKVKEGSRLFEVIEEAGGLLKNADTSQFNQAEIVADGSKIIIPEFAKASDRPSEEEAAGEGLQDNGKVNINIADRDELQLIPGVGPSTADKIISYRNSNGRFSKIEDIKNVSGIGEKTFLKMRFCISV